MSSTDLQARVSSLVARPLFWAALVGVLALVPIARAMHHAVPPAPALHLPLPPFQLTDQRDRPFGAEDLRGRVWVADFVFTSCPSVCPKLTQTMAQIQHRTKNLGDAFHLVTFSVDPETDTPARLASYATTYHADPSRWTFLTGSLADIETTVVKGFKIAMGKDPGDVPPATRDGGVSPALVSIFHGEKLVLVDASEQIRGYYDADEEGVDELLRNAEILVNTR